MLKCENVKMVFGGLVAVDNVTFEARENEFLAIIGPNGAGKTTLFNVIVGKYKPVQGKIIFNGEDITSLSPQKRIFKGLTKTFQIPAVFNKLTVAENIRVAAQFRKMNKFSYMFSSLTKDKECNKFVEDILERVGLLDYANYPAGTLPLGHKKRLEIGLALATQPRMLLLDEPTAGLTAEETVGISDFIKEISKRYSLIMVEHKIDVVMKLADRVLVMHQGSIIADGKPKEVSKNEIVLRVYLGEEE